MKKLTDIQKREFTVRALASLVPKLKNILINQNKRGHFNNDHIVLIGTTVKTITRILNSKKGENLDRDYRNLIKLIKLMANIPNLLEPTDIKTLETTAQDLQNESTEESTPTDGKPIK